MVQEGQLKAAAAKAAADAQAAEREAIARGMNMMA